MIAKIKLKNRIKGFSEDKKIEYLEKLLSKKKLLSPSARDAAYSLLGDVYDKKGDSDYSFISKSIEAYARAGEFRKIKKRLKKDSIYQALKEDIHDDLLNQDNSFFDYLAWPLKLIIPKPKNYIESGTPEADRLYDFINKTKRNRKKNNKLERHAMAIIIFGGILMGLFFLSHNFTGNMVGNSGKFNNLGGVVLLILSLIVGYTLVKKK